MVREVLATRASLQSQSIIIPFPVNSPERWRYYLPPNVVHYVRVFSDWEQAKVDRLREHGYRVEVLHPGIEKAIEASEVRRRMALARTGARSCPPPVVRVIERLKKTARAALMHILLIIFDGLADRPAPELDGKTPLEAARTPNLDRLAAEGVNGFLHPKSPGYPLGSPLALHLMFGYPGGRVPRPRPAPRHGARDRNSARRYHIGGALRLRRAPA